MDAKQIRDAILHNVKIGRGPSYGIDYDDRQIFYRELSCLISMGLVNRHEGQHSYSYSLPPNKDVTSSTH